jgi:predicted  nucleic acid-binding Zn-ribbon protein
MTRIKEPKIGITEVPEYKSPLKRIVKSLRKGYDNVREKVAKHSDTIQDLRGQLRDTQKSRGEWKTRAKEAEAELAAFNKKNANRELQDVKKKNLSKS